MKIFGRMYIVCRSLNSVGSYFTFTNVEHDYRYTYDTDKEMMILKMVDLVTGNGRGMIELVQVSYLYLSLI